MGVNASVKEKKMVEDKICTEMPQRVFLAGGNGLQTQTEAGRNAGCGILHVPEIKSGKSK